MRRLSTLFGAAPELQTLSRRAGEMRALQKIWETVSPPPLNRHSHVGLLDQGRLTVYAPSGPIAAKLKMQLNGLVRKLQTQGVQVTSIRVEVQVKSKPRAASRPQRRLSEQAAHSLLDFAGTLPESPLREAVKRLAKRT
jgi:hypothetical protein